jgi:glycosyltransferase involved in cell wall biosynthesis
VTLHVVQVHCVIDAEGRSPEALLAAWPTIPLVAGAAARAGVRVTVLCASSASATIRLDGVDYQFVREPRFRPGHGPGLAPWRLAAAARRLGPDVIHFNGLDFPVHLRALNRLGVPVLVQDHASSAASPRNALRRWGLRGIAAIAFTSAAQAEPFRQEGLLASGLPVHAIAESSTTFTPGSLDEARRALGIHGDPAVLWVANFIPRKDPLTMLRAVRRAIPRVPDLQLWCAFASGELLPVVQDLLREDQHLAAHVHLLGKLPHGRIETLCRACDIFVLGSRSEGSGYALIEALACGLTPVVSDIPPFRSLTGDGAVGVLAPVGDVDAFADGIVAAADAPRAEARAATLAHFERSLSPDALGRRLVEVYEALAAAASRG